MIVPISSVSNVTPLSNCSLFTTIQTALSPLCLNLMVVWYSEVVDSSSQGGSIPLYLFVSS